MRRVWDFGDGSATVTTTDAKSVAHDYPRAGAYTGQVTTWVLWGSSQVASAPRSFNVAIRDDGRVLSRSRRAVMRKSADEPPGPARRDRPHQRHGPGSRITYAGKKGAITPTRGSVTLKAGQTDEVLPERVSLEGLKSRRATIKISGWGGLATGMPQPSTGTPRDHPAVGVGGPGSAP